jgi:hypothetical protein
MQNKPTNEIVAANPIDLQDSRNGFQMGITPQAELWNGRFAMIGFIAYLFWDLGGVSVARDILYLVK